MVVGHGGQVVRSGQVVVGRRSSGSRRLVSGVVGGRDQLRRSLQAAGRGACGLGGGRVVIAHDGTGRQEGGGRIARRCGGGAVDGGVVVRMVTVGGRLLGHQVGGVGGRRSRRGGVIVASG